MQRTKIRSIEGKYRSRSKWTFLCTSNVTAVVPSKLVGAVAVGLVKVIMNQDNLLWYAAYSTRHGGCRQLSQRGIDAPSKTPAWVKQNARLGMQLFLWDVQ